MKKPRQRLSQEDVPGYPLDQALRIPKAIAENYAFKPTRPLNVAGAVGMSPTSGPFRMLTGAAVAYGLTTGAAQAPEIGLTPLGMRIVPPTAEGDDMAAMREALLQPKVIGDFLRTYDGAALPSDAIAKNVLLDKGVPADRLDGVLELIIEAAKAVGFIREWNGKRYVDPATWSPCSTTWTRPGVVFRSATEPFDTATAMGRMLVQMLGMFAQFERDTIIDQVIAGMERKAASGKWKGGRRPFGYQVDAAASSLVLDPGEAVVVRLIFDLYTRDRLGARTIANTLNERGDAHFGSRDNPHPQGRAGGSCIDQLGQVFTFGRELVFRGVIGVPPTG